MVTVVLEATTGYGGADVGIRRALPADTCAAVTVAIRPPRFDNASVAARTCRIAAVVRLAAAALLAARQLATMGVGACSARARITRWASVTHRARFGTTMAVASARLSSFTRRASARRDTLKAGARVTRLHADQACPTILIGLTLGRRKRPGADWLGGIHALLPVRAVPIHAALLRVRTDRHRTSAIWSNCVAPARDELLPAWAVAPPELEPAIPPKLALSMVAEPPRSKRRDPRTRR